MSRAGIWLSCSSRKQGEFVFRSALRRFALVGKTLSDDAGLRVALIEQIDTTAKTASATSDKNQKRNEGCRHIARLDLRSSIRTVPDASALRRSPERSANFGRIPVARNAPRTLPLSSMPVRSKRKYVLHRDASRRPCR